MVTTRVLVPDYLGGHVVAGISALHRAGVSCDSATWTRPLLGRFGISVREIFPLSSSVADPEAYARQVALLSEQQRYDAVIPFGLASYHALCQHDQNSNGSLPALLPSAERFAIANDKQLTTTLCRDIGIRSPATIEDPDLSTLPEYAEELRYPIVVKARSGSGVDLGLRYANSADGLRRAYEEIRNQEAPGDAYNFVRPILQEFVPGYINDVCLVANRGKIVNVLTQRRILMYPIQGGVGAINVTTHDVELVKLASTIVEALEWSGPAQIEFKYDDRDHEYKIIEFNPKFWGTLDLSIKAGMNFPLMVHDLILRKRVRKQNYKVGVRYKFFFPQATIAYWQIFRNFGIKRLFDHSYYARTFTDIDLRYPGSLIERMCESLYFLLKRKSSDLESKLPLAKEHIRLPDMQPQQGPTV